MGKSSDQHRPHSVQMARVPGPPTIIPGLGVDLPELRQARALWGANRFDDALALFEDAARKHPQNLVALVDASRALGARFELRRAEAMLDRLLKLGAQQPNILHLAGQSYRMIFRPDKAIDCFERVLRMTKGIPDAFLELAILYERRHRVEEAAALIEQCVRTDPTYLEAQFFKARLLRRLKNEGDSEALLRDLAASEQAHPQVCAQAWAEIAGMHDRQGEYAQAMDAMLKCKELLLQREGPMRKESEVVLGHLLGLTESLTADHFQRWTEAGRGLPMKKTAVLTSFPRSGTTLLEQVLDSHSGLVSSDEREAFARDIFPAMWLTPATPLPTAALFDAIPLPKVEALRERYLAYMSAALDEPIGDRIHLDKNPTLTLVLPGLLRLFPETRLLIALRDPRDVVISCFMQYLPLNANSVCFLTLERTASRYANDMAAWRKFRGMIASPWLEVRYEAVVANLEKEARRALEFLSLPWEETVLNYRDRLKQKGVGSPTYEAVSQPLYTRAIGRWQHYEEFLAPCLPILKPSIEAFGY
ncbi:MAG TPA: sulfotransferase [Patescibacteria group bacterium]|nr:sulfotransferase [Patescibacteria group bacterium]